jgi:cytochrome c-type biogenesis protein CcmH
MNSNSFLALVMSALLMLVSVVGHTEVIDEEYIWSKPGLDVRFEQLAYELRCPKCQNQNVADSAAPIAKDIRVKVAEMLNEGYTNEEIIDFMVARYTEFVTYRTRINWRTIWLYLAPAMLFGVGVLGLLFRTRRATPTVTLTDEQQARFDLLLTKPKRK